MGSQEGSDGMGTCFRDDTQAHSGSILLGPNPSTCGGFQQVSRIIFTMTVSYSSLRHMKCFIYYGETRDNE